MNNRQVLSSLESGFRHPKPPNTPQPMYDMMLKCWDKEADKRPTFEFIHQYFENYGVSAETSYEEPEERAQSSKIDGTEAPHTRHQK